MLVPFKTQAETWVGFTIGLAILGCVAGIRYIYQTFWIKQRVESIVAGEYLIILAVPLTMIQATSAYFRGS